jgi:hypothetical protein
VGARELDELLVRKFASPGKTHIPKRDN